MNTDIEDARVFSQFSERVAFAIHNDREFMCFDGIAVPKSLGITIALWVMTGTKKYYGLFELDHAQKSEILKMNPNDQYLSMKKVDHDIGWYLVKRLHNCMKTWSSQHFEELISN